MILQVTLHWVPATKAWIPHCSGSPLAGADRGTRARSPRGPVEDHSGFRPSESVHGARLRMPGTNGVPALGASWAASGWCEASTPPASPRCCGSTREAVRLDIETDVDWQECEKILKAAFPLDVRAAESSAEIPFGHVRRPTHTNTSWDSARFEICAHRYLHLAKPPGWGAAVVNDSSYGHDVTRDVRPDGGTTTTARISLLRAPLFPDPDCDRGEHRLRYGLVIGADIHDAIGEGYHFNLPERAVPGGVAVEPLVRTGEDGVVIEAVKLADDRSGDVVVRLYESGGGRVRTTLRAGFPVARS